MGVPIVTVDAFTDVRFSGNPAAVCVLAKKANEDWMKKVAREMLCWVTILRRAATSA